MQRNRYRTVWCTYTLVSLGALTAVNLILTRFLAINIGGFGRIQLGAIARIMAGLWFGPLAGGLCGLVRSRHSSCRKGSSPVQTFPEKRGSSGCVPARLPPASSVR